MRSSSGNAISPDNEIHIHEIQMDVKCEIETQRGTRGYHSKCIGEKNKYSIFLAKIGLFCPRCIENVCSISRAEEKFGLGFTSFYRRGK